VLGTVVCVVCVAVPAHGAAGSAVASPGSATRPAASGAAYAFTDLGLKLLPCGINDSDYVTLNSTQTTPLSAYVWHDGTSHQLSLLPGGTGADACDINNAGQVVGGVTQPSGLPEAASWNVASPGTPRDIGQGVAAYSGAGINASGDIVMTGETAAPEEIGYELPAGSNTPVEIGTAYGTFTSDPSNLNRSLPYAIADNGTILALLQMSNGTTSANGTYLLPSPGATGTQTSDPAHAMSENGSYLIGVDNGQYVELGPGSAVTPLPQGFVPAAVNNSGTLAGTDAAGNIALDQNGTVTDLGAVIPVGYTSAGLRGINNNGDLIGTSYLQGSPHGFLLSTRQLTVSGSVFGRHCGDSCNQSGVGGVKVLVMGTASDGSPISVTDTTAADGSWSVMVPPGSYQAGPSEDGSTFGPPGFDPSQLPATVTDKDVTGVNFVGCQVGDDTNDGAAPAASSVGRSGQVRPAATAAGPVNLCQSVYTVHVLTGIPKAADVPNDPHTGSPYVVDASSLARYDMHADPRTPDYRSANGAIEFLNHTTPFRQALFKGRQYPGCMRQHQVHELNEKGANVKWYSYITGTSFGSYSIPIAYNQDLRRTSLVAAPTVTRAKLTRVWEWKDGEETGHCSQKVRAPMLAVPITNGNTFTILLAWGFPFDPPGVIAHDSELISHLISHAFKKIAETLGEIGDTLRLTYENSSETTKFIFEIAVTLALSKGAFTLAEISPATLGRLAGGFTAAQVAYALEIADYAHIGHTLADVGSYINGYGGAYPIMSAVVRGKFTTDPLPAGFTRDTKLAISAKTTKFPTIGFYITRDVDPVTFNNQEPKSGLLLWGNTPFPTYSQSAVANSYPIEQSYMLNDASKGYYASGSTALRNINKDTEQLPKVDASLEDGDLTAKYEQEKDSATAPPACPYTAGPLLPSEAPKGSICWIFEDGRA
jgi:hypothetical protein